jgi:hypothetical protein
MKTVLYTGVPRFVRLFLLCYVWLNYHIFQILNIFNLLCQIHIFLFFLRTFFFNITTSLDCHYNWTYFILHIFIIPRQYIWSVGLTAWAFIFLLSQYNLFSVT